ncbi:MAG TPA: FxSxx-COOH system tetratricopeptide repeat protein [Ktedonobacteraceae bacterium]|nr:FxSxx-COOH system tetratricopeptide repeat protein [Ktedonobacteraceae bacterium]
MDKDAARDFFISYTYNDQRWAEWIAWQLEGAGYNTFLQAWDFLSGGDFVLAMDDATRNAPRTIAVLSPDYFTSKFTPSEWAAAFRRDPKGEQGLLMPVRVRPCDVEGLLGQIGYIDLVDLDEQAARTKLLAEAQRKRRKPLVAPTFPSKPTIPAPSQRLSFPGTLPAIWNIPYPRNPYFTGREDLLAQLAAVLRSGQTVGISQPQAVSGLGGVGKTQIALEYAYRYYQDYDAVLWTRADTQEALISGFVAFADLLSLPQKEERDQLKIVQAVKEWLKSHARWLLILDNADDLSLVQDFLPPAGKGHTLLTTRAASMGRLAQRVEVDTLDRDQGALLLLRRIGLLDPDAPLEQAEESHRTIALAITQELGGLPLALDQAGAYIDETQCSLADYLQLYRSQRAELLKARGGLVADHPEPVATTWSLSFAKVEQRSPAAADLLRLCAFLHPDAIPEEIITEGAEELGPSLQAIANNQLAFNQAIGVLLSYSLLKRNAEEHLLSIHRLVQAVLKDGMDASTYRLWAERAVQAVNDALPDEIDYGPPARYGRCLIHAQECALHIEQEQVTSYSASRLLYNTGIYLYNHARYNEAEAFYQHSLQIREQTLGPDHSDVAYSLTGLAGLHYEQGKYTEAELLFQRALRIWEQAWGPEDLLVATALNNLANLYTKQGKYGEAEPLYQRALRIREQAQEPDFSDMAGMAGLLNNLANLYYGQDQYAEAEALYQRALRIDEQAFGLDHPKVTYELYNLANLYKEQGKYMEAEPLYQRALRIWKQAGGPDHPRTRDVARNYADLMRKMGRESEAWQLEARYLWRYLGNV